MRRANGGGDGRRLLRAAALSIGVVGGSRPAIWQVNCSYEVDCMRTQVPYPKQPSPVATSRLTCQIIPCPSSCRAGGFVQQSFPPVMCGRHRQALDPIRASGVLFACAALSRSKPGRAETECFASLYLFAEHVTLGLRESQGHERVLTIDTLHDKINPPYMTERNRSKS